jgi:predicted 3-demethylubiquinone-9 3-methyltransferase (glyoxalase superfamily)
MDTPGAKAGSVLLVGFNLGDRSFLALNGGGNVSFNHAMSLSIDCADQAEVDRLWAAMTADGGKEIQCGWLTDKFGLSWQIVPRRLPELLSDPDPAKAKRVMAAMMGMVKLEVAALEKAAAG